MNFLCIFCALAFIWNASFPFSFYTRIEKAACEERDSSLADYLHSSFDFIGEGAQVIAFASQDGTTVLKIFKSKHTKPFKLNRFVRHIKNQNEQREISSAKWEEKFRATCRRYQMAFDQLQEETGLIALHFKATSTPLPVKLRNEKGKTFEIDLCDFPFILQKQATLLPTYLDNLLKEGRQQEAQTAIEKLKMLFVNRTLKGFTDPRQSLSINYGFIGDEPIQIDVGKIEHMPILKQHPEAEIKRIHSHIDIWVKTHFPNLSLETFSELK